MCLFPFYCEKVGSMLPCGKCIECLNSYSTDFAIRCMLEAREYSSNCFVTLTYNNENCPKEISKRELQLFTKKLRFHLSKDNILIRVFECGEYGEKSGRPHYHLIIFGWCPSDLVYFKTTSKGEDIYLSDFIASIWGKGFICVAAVTFRSCKYCAKYMQKLLLLDSNLEPPFILSSRRPGIGGLPDTIDYIVKHCLDTDKIYINGKYYKIPDYYLKVLEKEPDFADKVSNIRKTRKVLVLSRSSKVLALKRGKFFTLIRDNKDLLKKFGYLS